MVDNSYNQTGYIALMSAIVISALLLVISVSLGLSGFFTRFNVLNSEYKLKSEQLAKGCLDFALVQLELNSTTTDGDVNIADGWCSIDGLKKNYHQIGQTTIQTSAVFQQSKTTIVATFNTSDLSLVSFTQS